MQFCVYNFTYTHESKDNYTIAYSHLPISVSVVCTVIVGVEGITKMARETSGISYCAVKLGGMAVVAVHSYCCQGCSSIASDSNHLFTESRILHVT